MFVFVFICIFRIHFYFICRRSKIWVVIFLCSLLFLSMALTDNEKFYVTVFNFDRGFTSSVTWLTDLRYLIILGGPCCALLDFAYLGQKVL
jgi:hypothetical protein